MAQDTKISDINELVVFLAGIGAEPLFNNEIWQCYGYRKRPKKGNVWNKLFPKMFELSNFISREVLTMGLIDILNGIKKSTEAHNTKLLLALGVVDQFLTTTQHIFPQDEFMKNLFTTYAAYQKSSKSKLHEPIMLKAKEVLDKRDFGRFMIGTIKLFAANQSSDYLLKSDLIKDTVEKSSKGNHLKISMSKEMYLKYASLLEDSILNS